MKRFEVSTEIGSLSVTYQKQKKVLVCLNGAGLLPSYENFSLILEKPPPTIGYLTIDFPNTGRSPIHDQAGKNLDNLADAVYEVLEELGISEYILCAHSWSGILACKLLEKPIKRQTLVAIEPTTKKVMFADFSENPYPDDYLLLVMDNAIWHKSSTLKIPTNIGFAFIPPYTPEMNPIEQVWKEIRKRGFKNKAFRTLEDVIQGLEKEVIKSIVNRRWTRMLFESR
ncbi:alpha/beta fold hydrolase [Streptococcus pneumoniae]|uniref:alpha/beta fold hydrolase n=1 Tax=Streptococcus pneumoniae TaxID=1313 RepID=UPI0005DDC035|nr:alpha/beta fold hydrolase [Streptococcus pneumoniae]COM99575.1 alpha/beta fold family hydrolase [Streptococcus pneumoniae]